MSIWSRRKDSDFIGTVVSDKPTRRKKGRPKKNLDPAPEPPSVAEGEYCSLCKQPLRFDEWNDKGAIGFCDNTRCDKWHVPQGWK